MLKLLKADFYRILKSKLTYIILGIVALFPLITTLLYYGIDVLTMAALNDEELELYSLFNSKMLITSSFSLSNNCGIVIPIFAGIFICMDVTSGTLRNKIICGNSRLAIYLSHLTTAVVFNVVMILIYFFSTVAFSSIFFDYGTEFNAEEFKYILKVIVLGVLAFAFIASISTFFALSMKSLAPTIIFTIVFGIFLTLITTIVSILDFEKYRFWLLLIPTFGNSILTTLGNVLNTGSFLESIFAFLLFIFLNTLFGILIFKKKDIK